MMIGAASLLSCERHDGTRITIQRIAIFRLALSGLRMIREDLCEIYSSFRSP